MTLQKSGLTFQGFLKSVSIEVSVIQKEKRRKEMVAVHVGRVNHSHCTKIQFFPCTGMRVNLGRSKRCPILGSNFSKLTFNRRLSILDNKMCMCICHSILSTVARNGGQPPSTQSSGAKNVTPEYFIIK